jgi:hypothetical protein
MSALGDRKPTQLLAAMVEACPRGQENSVFMSALFLRKLLADVRILLAHMDHTRLKEMATAADQLVAMRAAPAAVAAVEVDPGEVAAVAARGGGTGAGRKPATAEKQKKKKPLEELEPSKAARQAPGCASGTGGMELRPSAVMETAAGRETGGPGATKRRRPRPSAARGGSVDRDQVPGG